MTKLLDRIREKDELLNDGKSEFERNERAEVVFNGLVRSDHDDSQNTT